jgi:DeoR-like helix-turn-helix domain
MQTLYHACLEPFFGHYLEGLSIGRCLLTVLYYKGLAIKDILCYNGQVIKDMNSETKKTEKLASALYLLTGFFNDLEPMKWRLRNLSGKLVEEGNNPKIILEIIGLLNVSKNAGLISDMNHSIVHKEFNNLLVQGQEAPILVEGHNETFVSSSLPSIQTSIQKAVQEKVSESTSIIPQRQEFLPKIRDKVFTEPTPSNVVKDSAVALKKNSRQTTILNLVKKKGEIMIKDVSPLIHGVSDKTIQRELLSLVKEGILHKEGEKRWSKYSLAN